MNIENSLEGTSTPGPIENITGQFGGDDAAQVGENIDTAIGLVGIVTSGASIANGSRSLLDILGVVEPINNMMSPIYEDESEDLLICQ